MWVKYDYRSEKCVSPGPYPTPSPKGVKSLHLIQPSFFSQQSLPFSSLFLFSFLSSLPSVLLPSSASSKNNISNGLPKDLKCIQEEEKEARNFVCWVIPPFRGPRPKPCAWLLSLTHKITQELQYQNCHVKKIHTEEMYLSVHSVLGVCGEKLAQRKI